MLARNFLSAKSLGISEADRKAAIEVLRMLEAGELQHIKLKVAHSLKLINYEPPATAGFNMAIWARGVVDRPACVGCMGYWMERVKGGPLSQRSERAFEDVLFPHVDPDVFEKIAASTPERAAWALRAKLQTGRADWGSA